MAILADVQYCIYADKVGDLGPKRSKYCGRIIGMAPNVAVCCTKVPNKCIGHAQILQQVHNLSPCQIWYSGCLFCFQ